VTLHLPSICETLGFIPSTTKKGREREREEGNHFCDSSSERVRRPLGQPMCWMSCATFQLSPGAPGHLPCLPQAPSERKLPHLGRTGDGTGSPTFIFPNFRASSPSSSPSVRRRNCTPQMVEGTKCEVLMAPTQSEPQI
jgi:hypothetical protein